MTFLALSPPCQVCQCFVFCALLEFALVNYASRSDMQRDRARERLERARRQWELEHAAADQQMPGAGPPPPPGGAGAASGAAGAVASAGGGGGAGSATTTLTGGGTNNGMNHIGGGAAGMPGAAGAPAAAIDTSVMDGGIPGFALVRRRITNSYILV